MIDILLTSYERKDFTEQVLGYLKKRTKTPFRLIIIDNGSKTPGTQKMLLEQKRENDILILLDKNYGLEISHNIGLRYVESDYFVTIDNDILVPQLEPDWLSQLSKALDNNLTYAALSLRAQILVGVPPIFKDKKYGEVVESNVVGGHARIMRTQAVRDVGGWTNQFVNDGRGNEEHDICGKLRANNWQVGYLNIWCHHLFGIDENWGYNNIKTKMGRVLTKPPKDGEFDPLTLEPKIKSNE